MFNILLYSSSSPLIQPQPQVPAALWLLMARDQRRGRKSLNHDQHGIVAALLLPCLWVLILHKQYADDTRAVCCVFCHRFYHRRSFSSESMPMVCQETYSMMHQLSLKSGELYINMILCTFALKKSCIKLSTLFETSVIFCRVQSHSFLCFLGVSFVIFRLYLLLF